MKKAPSDCQGHWFVYLSIVKILNMVEATIVSSQNSLSSVEMAVNASNGTPIISAITRESPGSSFLEDVVVATVMPKHLRIDWWTQ